jgi:hypothetical protein
VDEWSWAVLEAVDAWRYGTEDGTGFIESRFRALAVSARVLGVDGADGDDPAKVLVAALAETPEQATSGDAEKGWTRIRVRAATQRNQMREELLAVAAARQGATGKARAIDPSLLVPIALEVVKSWKLPEANPDDTNLARYVRSLAESIKIDLPFEHNQLRELLDKLRGYLPTGSAAPELGDLMLRAGDAAADAAVFSPPEELEEYRRACLGFKSTSLASIEHLADLMVVDWDLHPAQVLAMRARLDIDALKSLLQFCVIASRRLDSTIRRADSRLSTSRVGTELSGEIATLLESMDSLLTLMGSNA